VGFHPCEVALLAGVGREVEQQLAAGHGVPGVLEPLAHQVLRPVLWVVAAGGVLAVVPLSPVSAVRVAHEVDEVPTLDGVRHRDVRDRQECGHHVLQADRAVDQPAGGDVHRLGELQQEGDAGRSLVRVGLPPEVVVAEHLAVVRDHHHERVLEFAGHAQRVEHPFDLVVDVGDEPVVGGPGAVDDGRREVGDPRVGRRVVRDLLAVHVLGPVAHVRVRDVSVDVHVPVDLGRVERRVWADVREIQEERARLVAFLEEIQGAAGRPVGRVLVLLGVPRAGVPRVAPDAVREFLDGAVRLAVEPLRVVVVLVRGERLVLVHALEADVVAWRDRVDLAGEFRLVARIPKGTGQGVFEVPWGRDPPGRAVRERRLPRQHRPACRDARR